MCMCKCQVHCICMHTWPSLRASFPKVYAAGDGHIGDDLDSSQLLSYSEYRQLLRDTELLDQSFCPREASLTFVLARMRVVDERSLASRAKQTQLGFEEFLEAIVRVAG